MRDMELKLEKQLILSPEEEVLWSPLSTIWLIRQAVILGLEVKKIH